MLPFRDWVCPDKGLVQEVLVIPVRDSSPVNFPLLLPVYLTPGLDITLPLLRQLRENVYPGPRIFTPLGIMG